MKTIITQSQCAYMVPDSHAKEGYTIVVIPEAKSWWMSANDIKLDTFTQTFEVDIPGRQELAVLAVATLEERQKTILANAHKEHQELQQKINALLMLEHISEDTL
jgi:hypothetical protein